MDSQAVQELLSKKNVIVTGCPHDADLKFDVSGLRTVTGPMSTPISINGTLSHILFWLMPTSFIDASRKGPSGTTAVVCGVVQDLLDNAEDTATSKILNALDFPLFDRSSGRSPYSLDYAAWDITRALHIFNPQSLFPVGDVQWGLAGLKYSMTYVHEECDGFLTKVTVGTGGKAWGILRERSNLKKSSINFFLDKGFCLDDVVNNSDYDFEMVALRTGDCLYVSLLSLV